MLDATILCAMLGKAGYVVGLVEMASLAPSRPDGGIFYAGEDCLRETACFVAHGLIGSSSTLGFTQLYEASKAF